MATAAETPGNQGLGEGEAHNGTGDGTEVNTDQPTYLVIDYGDTWRQQLQEVKADYQHQVDILRQELRLLGLWLTSYFILVFPAMVMVFVHLLLQQFTWCQKCQRLEESTLLVIIFFDILFGLPKFIQHTRNYHKFLKEHGSNLYRSEQEPIQLELVTEEAPKEPVTESLGPEDPAEEDNKETPVETETPTGNLLEFD